MQCLQCTVLSRVPRMLYLILVLGSPPESFPILTPRAQMLGTPYLVFVIFSVGAGTVSVPAGASLHFWTGLIKP